MLRYDALSGGFATHRAAPYVSIFQGCITWWCYFIGLHPMLIYEALSGQNPRGLAYRLEGETSSGLEFSPEGVAYDNDGHRPSNKKTITSPEGA
jgi:hypothetical protein